MASDVTVLSAPAPVDLEEVGQRLAPVLDEAGADRAVVFGSYARRPADAWSDLDVVVILDTELPFLERGGLLREVFAVLPVPVDLLIYSPREFQEGMRRGRGVFHAIACEGVTIYSG